MMDAIYIELLAQMLEWSGEETRANGSKTGDKEIRAFSDEFVQAIQRAGYETPTAAAASTDSRFRFFLRVRGKPELSGVYYVSGWADRGTVSLSWDPHQDMLMPRRREAIMATRAKNRAKEVIL
jgi:hypothetical protein